MRNLPLAQLAAHLTMQIAGKRIKVVRYMVAPRHRTLISAVQWKSPSLFGDRKTSHVPHADAKFSRQQPGAVSVEQPSLRLNQKTTLLTSELKGKLTSANPSNRCLDFRPIRNSMFSSYRRFVGTHLVCYTSVRCGCVAFTLSSTL